MFIFDSFRKLTVLLTAAGFLSPGGARAEADSGKPRQVPTMVGRQPDFPPLCSFTSAEGWTVEVVGEGKAAFTDSAEVTFFGDSVTKLSYEGVGPETVIRVLAERPIKIGAAFDAVDWWIWGNRWGYGPVSWVPALLLEDGRGQEKVVEFPAYHWEDAGPSLYHAALAAGELAARGTYFLKGVQFSGFQNATSSRLFVGPLSLYQKSQEQKPVAVEPLQNLLPVTPDSMIPPTEGFSQTQAFDPSTQTWTGRLERGAVKLEIQYTPTTGTLADFRVLSGGKEFTPLQDGGLCFPRDKAPQRAKLDSCAINPETQKFESFWTMERRAVGKLGEQYVQQVAYTIRAFLQGNSLVIEVESDSPDFERLSFGYAQGLENPKLIEIPYLNFWGYHNGVLGPKVVYDNGLYFLGMIDVYLSQASDIYASDTGITSTGDVHFNGGSKYLPNTENVRNPVRDRMVLSFSDELHEVFPNIPNPPALNQEQTRDFVYTQYPWPDLELPLLLSNMGFQKLRYGIFWTVAASTKGREWDWFTKYYGIRPEAFPNTPPEDFKAYLGKFGYLFKVYQYILGMNATDELWDRSKLARAANRNWLQGCAPFYLPKPIYLPSLRDAYAKRLAGLIDGGIYSDVLTVLCPWGAVIDYDGRVEGNGSLQANLQNIAYVLRKDQEDFGSSWSEGSFNWITAGCATGSYGSLMTTVEGGPSKMPILPEFKLRRMNPLTVNVGMGPGIARLFEGNEAFEKKTDYPNHHDEFFNQYLAALIGYGNQMQINSQDIRYGMNGWAKLYYMLRTIQRYYSFEKVDRVEYWDGKSFQSTSQAVADESYRDGRLRVVYQSGLEVFVNYNGQEDWEITAGGQPVVLPPWGFHASHPASGTVSYSALVKGKRVEYAKGGDYYYVDSWDAQADFPEFSVDGVAAITMSGKSRLKVIPCGGNFFGKPRTPEFGCRKVTIHLKKFAPHFDRNKVKVFAIRQGIPASGEGDFTIDEPRYEEEIVPEFEGDSLIIRPGKFFINYEVHF